MGLRSSRGRRFAVLAGLALALVMLLPSVAAQASPGRRPGHGHAHGRSASRTAHAPRPLRGHRPAAARPARTVHASQHSVHLTAASAPISWTTPDRSDGLHRGLTRRSSRAHAKPAPSGIPIGITVGRIHVKVTVPLPRLGRTTPTPTPTRTSSSSPAPSASTTDVPAPHASSAVSAPDPTSSDHGVAPAGPTRRATPPRASATPHPTPSRTHAPTRTPPVSSRVVALFPLAAPFESPTGLLVTLVVLCAAGVGVMVFFGSARRRRT